MSLRKQHAQPSTANDKYVQVRTNSSTNRNCGAKERERGKGRMKGVVLSIFQWRWQCVVRVRVYIAVCARCAMSLFPQECHYEKNRHIKINLIDLMIRIMHSNEKREREREKEIRSRRLWRWNNKLSTENNNKMVETWQCWSAVVPLNEYMKSGQDEGAEHQLVIDKLVKQQPTIASSAWASQTCHLLLQTILSFALFLCRLFRDPMVWYYFIQRQMVSIMFFVHCGPH